MSETEEKTENGCQSSVQSCLLVESQDSALMESQIVAAGFVAYASLCAKGARVCS